MRAGIPRALAMAASALAAIAFIVILSSLFTTDRLTLWVPVVIAGLAVLAAVRPDLGLLLVAALTPVAAYAGRRWNPEIAWAEVLVVAFAAGWFARRLIPRGAAPVLPAPLRHPVLVFGSVVFASAIVLLSVDNLRLGRAELVDALWQFFAREFFAPGSFLYLHAAALLVEGLVLFSAAARFASADRRFALRAALALSAGAAVAAAVNLGEVIASARRFDHAWTRLVQTLMTTRINVHYGDVNAAGSQFAMLLFVAAAVALGRRRLARVWFAAAAFVALGLWMSGSRTAMFASPVALAIVIIAGAQARAARTTRLVFLAGGLLLAGIALVVLVYAPPRGSQIASAVAVDVRVEMARTAAHMVADRPAFGVGLGQFSQRSGDFSSPELLRVFPAAVHENAHNNFLQMLAETGLLGFAAFIWLLAASIFAGGALAIHQPSDMLAWGCFAGIVAFLITCLGGHPLLTREVAYAFWILLGMMAGRAWPPSAISGSKGGASMWSSRIAVAAAACLMLSVPMRAASEAASANFEHVGIGLSAAWETAPDGTRYRSGTTAASVFVPGEKGFRFKVRSLTTTTERLELRLGGRVVDVVLLAPNHWNDVSMPPRTDRAEARFIRLDMRVLGDDGRDVTIWVTKVQELGG